MVVYSGTCKCQSNPKQRQRRQRAMRVATNITICGTAHKVQRTTHTNDCQSTEARPCRACTLQCSRAQSVNLPTVSSEQPSPSVTIDVSCGSAISTHAGQHQWLRSCHLNMGTLLLHPIHKLCCTGAEQILCSCNARYDTQLTCS